jgi:hypothetical protein
MPAASRRSRVRVDREVALAELMSDNATMPQDAQHVETEWTLIQTEPASGGNQRRQRKQNEGGLELAASPSASRATPARASPSSCRSRACWCRRS